LIREKQRYSTDQAYREVKIEGLSLQCAIVDVGNRCFGLGMMYVALSRVTTSAALHLVEFDKTKIYCDVDALIEYNRLRKIYRTDLPLFEFPERQLRGTPDEVPLLTEISPTGKKRESTVVHAVIEKENKRKVKT
jgi:hypothetical protein